MNAPQLIQPSLPTPLRLVASDGDDHTVYLSVPKPLFLLSHALWWGEVGGTMGWKAEEAGEWRAGKGREEGRECSHSFAAS